MRVQHLRHKVVDREMCVLRPSTRLHPRAYEHLEVVQPRSDGDEQHERDGPKRYEQAPGEQLAPVRDGEDHEPDAEAEQAAARQRRDLHEEEKAE